MEIDRIDRRILEQLQGDAMLPLAALSERVGLSQNAVWRRVKRLEADGVIASRVALLDPDKVGLGVTVFVSVRTNQHTPEWLERFARGIAAIPEVVEFYRMSGEVDYLMKLLVRDIADYDRVYKKLISVMPLSDVSSSFAMERIKHTTRLSLDGPR